MSGGVFSTSRIARKALWKFIGDGFLSSVAAIFARFLFLRSAIAPVHSAFGFLKPALSPARSAATQEPISPITGAAIATLLSISVGEISTCTNLFGSAPHVFPFQ